MTAIAGIVHEGRVWIGGDSAGTSGWSLTIRRDEKVFANGPFLIGFTSSFRMGQLLRWSFHPPEQSDDEPVERYMATTFIDAVRKCLKDGGYAAVNANREEGGDFLVGYRGRLFEINSDFQIGEPVDPMAAVGAGSEVCLGSLYGSSGKPRARLIRALEAAEHFNASVRGPFTVRCEP